MTSPSISGHHKMSLKDGSILFPPAAIAAATAAETAGGGPLPVEDPDAPLAGPEVTAVVLIFSILTQIPGVLELPTAEFEDIGASVVMLKGARK